MNQEAKNYIAVGVILIFIILFMLFPWKPILVIMLAWMSLNCFHTAMELIKKITERKNENE